MGGRKSFIVVVAAASWPFGAPAKYPVAGRIAGKFSFAKRQNAPFNILLSKIALQIATYSPT